LPVLRHAVAKDTAGRTNGVPTFVRSAGHALPTATLRGGAPHLLAEGAGRATGSALPRRGVEALEGLAQHVDHDLRRACGAHPLEDPPSPVLELVDLRPSGGLEERRHAIGDDGHIGPPWDDHPVAPQMPTLARVWGRPSNGEARALDLDHGVPKN